MKRTVLFCDRHTENMQADETVVFSTSDGEYEIDLCAEHVKQWRLLEADLATWVASARSTDPSADQTPARSKSAREENQAIRAWAPTVDVKLGTHGRIPDELRARYRKHVAEQARERWNEEVGRQQQQEAAVG